MTLRAVSNRDNNVEAQFDSTSRSVRFDKKIQLARLRRRTSSSTYGVVRWFWDASGDGSEAEIVTYNGTRVASPTLVWVDMATSIEPKEIGNAYYLLQLVGRSVTRGGTTRDLYRATMYLGRPSGANTVVVAAQAEWTAAGYAKVQNSTGTDITTTINAVAGVNQWKVKTPYDPGAVAAKFDLPTPFFLRWNLASSVPCIIPEWTQRSRLGCWVSGGTISIDWGEPFLASFAAQLVKNATFEVINLNGTFICYYDAGARNLRVQYMAPAQRPNMAAAITSVNFGASSTTNGQFVASLAENANISDPTIGTGTAVNAATSPVAIAVFKDAAGVNSGTLNFTFTENATTKRLTAWGLSVTGLAAGWLNNGGNLSVYGGRENVWPWAG